MVYGLLFVVWCLVFGVEKKPFESTEPIEPFKQNLI
jgi:hypothetical protein